DETPCSVPTLPNAKLAPPCSNGDVLTILIVQSLLSVPAFLFVTGLHPRSTLFPYTTLFRSRPRPSRTLTPPSGMPRLSRPPWRTDRKSTRLNSSHVSRSYAVYCVKKKN